MWQTTSSTSGKVSPTCQPLPVLPTTHLHFGHGHHLFVALGAAATIAVAIVAACKPKRRGQGRQQGWQVSVFAAAQRREVLGARGGVGASGWASVQEGCTGTAAGRQPCGQQGCMAMPERVQVNDKQRLRLRCICAALCVPC